MGRRLRLSISQSSESHGGAKSCKFCMDRNFEAFLTRTATVPVKAGEEYYGAMRIRGASSQSELESAGLRGSDLELATEKDRGKATSGPPTTAEWALATTLFTTSADAESIAISFRLQQQGNPASVGNVICVYVDDAVIRRIK